LRQAERSFASYSGEAAELSAQIAATEVKISETRLEIIQINSEFHNDVVSELGEVQTSLQDATEREIALRDIVNRTVVRAPDSGVVNGMKIHTVAGVINSGAPIAEIVPDTDDLIIEASVSPIDIDRVTEGQDARIRFSTFGSSVPTIFGRVITLSADAVTDETTGAEFYLARLEVFQDSMESLDGLALVPGMPAEVYINTGSRTLLQYLFKPLSNAIARSFNED
jgi:epimerase transport system membrane fusion protein